MKPNPVLLHCCLSLLVALLAAGCNLGNVRQAEPVPQEIREAPKVTPPAPPPVTIHDDKALQELQVGVASYENGNYKLASRQLQSALSMGLESPGNQARAHKYLAFMYCVGSRQSLCRDEFRKAIEADPAFDLSPAEAGHPTWGPVFRKLKTAGKSAKK